MGLEVVSVECSEFAKTGIWGETLLMAEAIIFTKLKLTKYFSYIDSPNPFLLF